MKLMNICLITLIIAHTYPTQSLSASYYTPGIVCASGALLSAAGTFWANKKVKTLEALNDLEKNNPNIRKTLRRWKAVRRVCGFVAAGLTIASFELLKNAPHYKRLQEKLYHERAITKKETLEQKQLKDPKYIQKKLHDAAKKANSECGVCLERIDNTAKYALGSPSLLCDHFYCTDCIATWRISGRSMGQTCPSCRKE